jgi:hypothetical protein
MKTTKVIDLDKHTPGPWVCPIHHGSEADNAKMLELGLALVPALTNEGQRFIMTTVRSPDGPDIKRVALVDAQVHFKRGKGHQSECEERDANAALIAKAPEMREALKRICAITTGDGPHGSMDRLNAIFAIAKGAL